MPEQSFTEISDELQDLDKPEPRIRELSGSELDAVSGGIWVNCLTGSCGPKGQVWID